MKKFTLCVLILAVLASALVVFSAGQDTSRTTQASTSSAYGDVNGDGKVSLSDASLILKYIAKFEVEIDTKLADVTGNGRVNLTDVSRILKRVAKWNISLNPAETTVYDIAEDGFAVADFEKKEFKILHYGETATDFHDRYIWPDSYNGDVIDEAVKERNSTVEDRYNVKITAEECGPAGEAAKRQQAGQCDFEVIYEWGVRMRNLAVEGFLYDLNELTYANLDRSYWVPSAVESLTVSGRLYMATNMVSMNSLAWADILYFNKNLMDKLNIMYPYDLVKEGNWTYDALIPMVMAAEEDVNRDGVMDNRDQYGGISGNFLLRGVCSEPLVKDNGDGTYEFIPYTENLAAQYSKYSAKLRSIEELTKDEILEGVDTSAFPSKYVAARYLSFGEDHTLFLEGNLEMSNEFVDMQSDYGILPMPVVNPGDDYVSTFDYIAPLFAVPLQVDDPDMTAIVFDYMAWESEELLLPAYYETTIKTKRMQDTRDYDTIDIVRNSATCSWIDAYMFDSDTVQFRDRVILNGTFASMYKRYAKRCQDEIDELTERILSLES